MPLPGSAALGHWRLAPEGFETEALGLSVAEYRSVEFKVRVDASEPSRKEGEIGRFDVQADYLFGSPMAGRALRYSATRERRSYAPPGSEGFVTDEDAFRAELPQSALEASVFVRGEATLSARASDPAPARVAPSMTIGINFLMAAPPWLPPGAGGRASASFLQPSPAGRSRRESAAAARRAGDRPKMPHRLD